MSDIDTEELFKLRLQVAVNILSKYPNIRNMLQGHMDTINTDNQYTAVTVLLHLLAAEPKLFKILELYLK